MGLCGSGSYVVGATEPLTTASGRPHGVCGFSLNTDLGAQSRRPWLVGCGHVLPDEQARIVDPDTRRELKPHEIGEIWVSSPSVAQGYWNNRDATEQSRQLEELRELLSELRK